MHYAMQIYFCCDGFKKQKNKSNHRMINRLIILYALFIIALKDCFSFQLSRKFAKKEQILTIKSYSSSPSKLRSGL